MKKWLQVLTHYTVIWKQAGGNNLQKYRHKIDTKIGTDIFETKLNFAMGIN